MRITSSVLLAGFVAGPALAAGGTVSVTVPQLKVAEYHKPYVAAWIEGAGGASTVAVWYDVRTGQREPGTKWLNDMRTWWRKGGRSLKFPADGVSGATRAPGVHNIALTKPLAPGSYTLFVEAAREVGGREVVSIPFQWPPKSGQTLKAAGKSELGAVSLTLKP